MEYLFHITLFLFFLLTISQITIGAPIIEVIALMGKVNSKPGICENVSQINIIVAPIKSVPANKILWLLVRNNNFPRCGTANPIKAIGPAKAVMLPASMLVANMIT